MTNEIDEWEKPSLAYKLEDILIKKPLSKFIYGRFIDSLAIKGNERILVFGCGSGCGTKLIAKKIEGQEGELVGIDTSKYWTNVACKRLQKYSDVRIINKEIEKADFKAQSFDIITCHYVLHDCPKEARNTIVSEFSRLLKADGKLFIKEPQRENDGMPVDEIKKLMGDNCLKEINASEKNGLFTATYSPIK